MSARYAHALPFGAEVTGAHSTRFRIWAPASEAVQLELDGREPLSMRGADGWFELEADCAAGSCYRYRVQPDLVVADPAARAQAGDVHDASIVIDPRGYEWQHDAWRAPPWARSVIYEIHAGIAGGFEGVRAFLPHIKLLGASAVQLMPIADFSGKRNWGYDGVLPYAPDSSYGSPHDLKRLIDEAHGLGLCVYLDVVYNHFGPDGNHLHAYAPQFFDEGQQSPWGAAIDFSRREVRDYYIHNALYWLNEYRFDGLRFDAVHAIGDEGFLVELAQRIRAGVEPDREVHLVLENEKNLARLIGLGKLYDAQWNDDGHNVLHVLLTNERESYYANYADRPVEKLARCLAEGFVYQGESSPSHGGKPRGTPSTHLPPAAFVLFLQNHDQVGNRARGERLTALAPPPALEAAIAMLLLCPQVPLLFMGEEWGAATPFLYFTDFHDELATAVCDGRRREFAAFAAFNDPAQRTSIPDPNAVSTFEQSRPDFYQRSEAELTRLAYYRRLLALRQEHLAPRLAGSRSAGVQVLGAKAVRAAWRLGDGAVLTVAMNLDELDVACKAGAGMLLFSTDGATETEVLGGYSTRAWLEPSNG